MSSNKIEDLEEKLNDLNADIRETRDKRDDFNNTTQEIISLLKQTNSKIKDHLKKASQHRDKRDAFNDEVQVAKNNRITTQIALEELRKKLDEIKNKYKEIKPISTHQRREINKLRSAVRARNMEIVTKPDLTVNDEERLIKEIEELEIKLGQLTKGSKARREYSKIIAQFPVYKGQLRKYHQEVVKNSEESQKYHELMIKEYEKVDELRERIKELEKELNENKKIADQHHQDLLKLYKQRNKLRDGIHSTQRRMRIQRRKERGNIAILKRRLAKERLDGNQKLDFVEFRLLLEKNQIP